MTFSNQGQSSSNSWFPSGIHEFPEGKHLELNIQVCCLTGLDVDAFFLHHLVVGTLDFNIIYTGQ